MISYEFINNKKDETIVAVHGFTQNRNIFENQVAFFKEKYNIFLIDLRGHGESYKINGPYGIEEYTDDIQEIFEKMHLKNVIYWGTHTGSAIGLNLYFRKPEYISYLILEGAVIPGYDTIEINRNIQRTKEIMKKKGLKHAINDWLSNSEWFQYTRNNADRTRFKEHEKIILDFKGKPLKSNSLPKKIPDILSKLDKIEIPILVYNGQYDMEEFFLMRDIIKSKTRACIIIIPDSGGFPLWENPNFVNKAVSDWLSTSPNSV